jgi:hypothetical protein
MSSSAIFSRISMSLPSGRQDSWPPGNTVQRPAIGRRVVHQRQRGGDFGVISPYNKPNGPPWPSDSNANPQAVFISLDGFTVFAT